MFAEDGFVDLAEGGFDAGIRLGEYLQADMVAVRLTAPFRFLVAGTPAYFEKHGRPERPSDLRRMPCVRYRQMRGTIPNWSFVDGNRPIEVAVNGPVIVNDLTAAMATMLQDIALVHVAEPLVEEGIAKGEIETVLDDYAASSPGIYLYYPGRAQMLPKLRAFIDYIRENQPPEKVLERYRP
ncbi:LysR substrate-binding domain-containing protein [Sphingoaurantiacus capsulatus]|uniref:LysR substrate-binding domain-containing protein n=1 Tax=Sphingoaurantiacus capsulatus TaxID=1771310 RepID=A0ABV7X6W7_9SPHN